MRRSGSTMQYLDYYHHSCSVRPWPLAVLALFRAFFKNWLRPQIMPEIAHSCQCCTDFFSLFQERVSSFRQHLKHDLPDWLQAFYRTNLRVWQFDIRMVLCGLPCGLLGPVRRVSLMCSKFCWYSLIVFTCSARVGTSMWLSHCGHGQDGQEMVISQKWRLVTAAVAQLTAVDSSWQLTRMSFRSRTPWTKKTWLVSKNCRRSLTVTMTNAWH